MASVVCMAPKKKPDTDSIRIKSKIVKQARMVAAARDISLPEYLAQLLDPLVERDLQEILQRLTSRRAGVDKSC